MKIAVLNGSPKGMTSVTMQYVLFLQKKLPQHQFLIVNVCQDLRKLEDDEQAFGEVVRTVAASDGVLWAFPLYYLLVHAHYKRFIELLFARGARDAFRGKYAATLSTSIRFFDHTAHDYVGGICDDLDMNCVGSYSAAMYDLLKPEERDRLLLFADGFLRAVEQAQATPRRFQRIVSTNFTYHPGAPAAPVDTAGKSVILVTDAESPDGNLAKMVGRLQSCLHGAVSVVNLRAIQIRGGCLGCCQCGLDNVCVYKDTDDVHEAYRRLMAADVLFLAGTIQDRYLSSRWKLFFDRGFFHNHVPMFAGKQIGCVVSGPLGQLSSLRQILDAYVGCQQANLVGIVTDECGDSQQLDRLLDALASRAIDLSTAGYISPPDFLAVAGAKLLRDEIWSGLRVVFQADHRYYRRHGLYDFPRRSLRTRLTDAVLTLLTKIPSFRREFRKRLTQEMIKPLQEVLETA